MLDLAFKNCRFVSLFDMHRFDFVQWQNLLQGLQDVERQLVPLVAHSPHTEFEGEALTILSGLGVTFDGIAQSCELVELMTAAQLARDAGGLIGSPGLTPSKMRDAANVLAKGVTANMKAIMLMRIPQEYANYIDPKHEGLLLEKFPRAMNELRFAGQALAYDLGTASVFHCMRAMEVGLKVLGLRLGIPYAPSWESYLRQFETLFAQDYKKKTDDLRKAEPYYRELAGDLQVVKLVWRNPTMHVVRTYTQSEAREVHSAVTAFVSRLAVELQEAAP